MKVTDSLSSVMAVLDPHTPHQLVRDIQSLLTQNRNILVRWIKAHVGYREHGPFPSFLNRFHLSDSDSCACGEVGDNSHHATSCPLTLSWRIRRRNLPIHRKVCGSKEFLRIRIREKEY
ncbi:hypothetical protein AVEN_60383-1 [Araneus ventricosus]|uniref:RNase H type-1 domain-containing protein n=1 Tax=Araneus ventricosus TaxID=182803 RepID=A0A4Y2H1T9_ARAVE|nr:hypothetical protein AVEN_60383-1 [Araneus ventricosus]